MQDTNKEVLVGEILVIGIKSKCSSSTNSLIEASPEISSNIKTNEQKLGLLNYSVVNNSAVNFMMLNSKLVRVNINMSP